MIINLQTSAYSLHFHRRKFCKVFYKITRWVVTIHFEKNSTLSYSLLNSQLIQAIFIPFPRMYHATIHYIPTQVACSSSYFSGRVFQLSLHPHQKLRLVHSTQNLVLFTFQQTNPAFIL